MWWHGTQYSFLAILWLFPPLSAHVSQVWESVIKSICQTSPYLHFRGKTRELYSLGLYSQAIQLHQATGSEYQGLLQAPHYPWAAALVTGTWVPGQHHQVPCPTTGQGFGTGLMETWHGAASGSLGSTTGGLLVF